MTWSYIRQGKKLIGEHKTILKSLCRNRVQSFLTLISINVNLNHPYLNYFFTTTILTGTFVKGNIKILYTITYICFVFLENFTQTDIFCLTWLIYTLYLLHNLNKIEH